MGAAGRSPLNSDLQDVLEQLDRVTEDAQRLCSGVSDQQFNWRPAADRWSISECLEHLNLADANDVTSLKAVIDDAARRGIRSSGPFRYGKVSTWFVGTVEPPAKHKAKAVQALVPRQNLSVRDVLEKFLDTHKRLAQVIEQANGIDLVKVKVPAPVGPFKLPLGQKFRLIAGHDRRHLYQAWEVRNAPSFPKS
jgi:hypothetical protein